MIVIHYIGPRSRTSLVGSHWRPVLPALVGVHHMGLWMSSVSCPFSYILSTGHYEELRGQMELKTSRFLLPHSVSEHGADLHGGQSVAFLHKDHMVPQHHG